MNPQREHDIDALLRQSFDGPVADAGFSDNVMRHVPLHRRRSAWPLALGVLAGAMLCWLTLYDSALWRAAWQGWLAGECTASTIVPLMTMAVLALLALGWTLAEADDH